MRKRSGAIDQLETLVEAGRTRIAQANRYPMMLRRLPGPLSNRLALTISKTEYLLTRGEMVVLRDMLDHGIARLDAGV